MILKKLIVAFENWTIHGRYNINSWVKMLFRRKSAWFIYFYDWTWSRFQPLFHARLSSNGDLYVVRAKFVSLFYYFIDASNLCWAPMLNDTLR